MNACDPLLEWLTGPGPSRLPERAADAIHRSLIDTCAVAWGARTATGMSSISALAASEGGTPQSLLWDGSGRRVPSTAAAFHNGCYAAALDFDSLHPDVSHIDAVVIPAAIAVAQQVGADGRSLIYAIAAGTELAYRLARAGQAPRGWFRTSIYGVFGAAAASARLLGLNKDGMSDALGIALGQVAGTQQGHLERTLSKRLLSAFAARAGVHSALLAQRGISGPRFAFDGPHGLFALYGRCDPQALLDQLGTTFLFESTTYKRYPACGRAHAAIEAALRLTNPGTELPVVANDIDTVTLTLTSDMHELVGAPYSIDGTPEVTGQFCAQYAVAAALTHGKFEVQQISEDAVLDPTLRPLIDRISIQIQGRGNMAPATIQVRLRNGQIRRCTVSALPGGSEAPLGIHELSEKAQALLRHGAELSASAAQQFLHQLHDIRAVNDVNDLFLITP